MKKIKITVKKAGTQVVYKDTWQEAESYVKALPEGYKATIEEVEVEELDDS